MPHDRDKPRPGRLPDALAPDGIDPELTPPPIIVDDLSGADTPVEHPRPGRRRRMTRREFDEEIVWPLRNMPNELTKLATRVSVAESKLEGLPASTEDIEELRTAITDIRGESGNNGKLGALKERVDKAESRRWWLITFVAGTVLAVAAIVYRAGSLVGDVNSRLHQVEQRLERMERRNRFWPATPAEETP